MKDVAVVSYCRTGIAKAGRGALNQTHGIPMAARLAFDVGGGGLVLRIQRAAYWGYLPDSYWGVAGRRKADQSRSVVLGQSV